MKKIEAIIVDDEFLAREDIKNQLSRFDNIKIVGEADSLSKARSLYKEVKPNIIFLDIQLGNESGFNLLDSIEEPTKIIFVTAFNEYAIKAFEVNALDYLLKPVSYDRLEQTIERITRGLDDVTYLAKLTIDDNIFIKLDSNYRFLKIDSIKVITSAKDYTEIYINNENRSYLALKSLKEWDERLPESQFCRIHRSTIININFIAKIEPWHNNSQRVYIKGIKEPFLMSRRYFSVIKDQLG